MASVDRWASKHPGIRRFDEDGNMTAAARAAREADPKASDAVVALTGVSRNSAPTPVSQLLSAFVRGLLRQIPTSTLIRLHSVQSVPLNARVYREKAGDGTTFCRLRYEEPRVDGKRQRKSIYLGTDLAIGEWAAGILVELRWRADPHKHPSVDQDRIAQLKRLRRQVTGVARQIAKRAGYTFRGSRLLKRRYE